MLDIRRLIAAAVIACICQFGFNLHWAVGSAFVFLWLVTIDAIREGLDGK